MTIREYERKKRRGTRLFGAGILGVSALIGVFSWMGVLPLDALLVALALGIAGMYDLFKQLP